MDDNLAVKKWSVESEFTNNFVTWLENKKSSIKELIADIINIEIGYKEMLLEKEYEMHDGTFSPEKLSELVKIILKDDPNFAYWYAKYREEVNS